VAQLWKEQSPGGHGSHSEAPRIVQVKEGSQLEWESEAFREKTSTVSPAIPTPRNVPVSVSTTS
jgi:hypothetical protein